MRAVTYERFGSAAEVLSVAEFSKPLPGPGEVLVRLHASGVNPSDIRARAGGRPGINKPPFPMIIPHSDGAGIIEAVGDGVASGRVGERVWIWNGQWQRAFGTAAEYIALPANQAVTLPDGISFDQGAILGIPGLTATHMVLGAGPVEGKTVLISGGAGTVGRLAVQIAVASGARVIATAHGEHEFEAARSAGAPVVLDYSAADLAKQIADAAGNVSVDLAIEVEFGKHIDTLATVLGERGRIVTYGSALEMTPVLPFYPLLFKAITIELVLVYLLNERERATAIKHLTKLLNQNALDLRISQTLELAECAKAHEFVSSGQRAGSVILTM